MATGPSGQIDIDLGDSGGGDSGGGGGGGGGGGINPGDISIDPGDIDVDTGGDGGGDSGPQGPGGTGNIPGAPEDGGDTAPEPDDSVTGTEPGGGGRGPSGQPDIDVPTDGGDAPTPDDSVSGTQPGGGGRGPSGQPDVTVPDEVTGAPGKEPPGEPVDTGRPDAVRELAPGEEPPDRTAANIGREQTDQLISRFEQQPGVDVDRGDFRTRRIETDQGEVIRTAPTQSGLLEFFGGAREFQFETRQTAAEATQGMGAGRNITAEQTEAVTEQQEQAVGDIVRGGGALAGGAVEGATELFGGGGGGGPPSEGGDITPSPQVGQATTAPGFDPGAFRDTDGGPIAGPPGQIERAVLGPITGPPSDTEQEITGAIESAGQPFLGPPGQREQQLGGFTADVTQGIESLGEDISERTRPAGETAGRAFGSLFADPLRAFGQAGAGETIRSGAGAFGRGIGRLPGEVGAAPEGIRQLGETGFEATQDVAIQAGSGEVPEAGERAVEGVSNFALQAGAGLASQVAESPLESAGAFTGGLVGGTFAARAIERGATAARFQLTRRRAAGTVDVEDLTEEEVAEALAEGRTDVLPTFETGPGAPTRQAVEEFRERGEDVPEELQEAAGSDVVTFRSELERFSDDFDVAETGTRDFELSGLFVSPDFSPLNVDLPGGGAGGLASFRPSNLRLPRLRGTIQRGSAFETPEVRGIPEQTMAGETRFLRETAEEGTAFVRGGSRTTELEGLFPPGTSFSRQSVFAMDIPGRGRGGTIDVFRQADVDAPDVDPEDLVTGEEIAERARESRRVAETEAVGPPLVSPGFSTFGTATTPAPGVTAPTTPTDIFDFSPTTPTTTGTGAGTTATTAPEPTTAPTTPSEPATVTEPAPVTEPTTPTRPSDVFRGTVPGTTPTEPATTPTEPVGGPSTPTGPPSEPGGGVSQPLIPGSDTVVPGTPPPPPSRTRIPPPPPTTPGIGSPPPPPSVPGDGGGPPGTPQIGGGEPDSDEEEFEPILPAGTPFVNPVATGGQVLFGDLLDTQ